MNKYLTIIAVLFACTAYNTILLLNPSRQPTPEKVCPLMKVCPDRKNIYDKIVESFPLYYSSMFYAGGDQILTMKEYDDFFKLNPEYSKYKMGEGVGDIKNADVDRLEKVMFSKLITDTLCSKYISERNLEIVNMDNDQLVKWLIEKNNMILSRYPSNKPSELDVWTSTLRDVNRIRPEAISVLKRNFFMSKEKI